MLHETSNLPPIIPIKLSNFAVWKVFKNGFSDIPNFTPFSKNLPSKGPEIIPLSSVSSDEVPLARLIPKKVCNRLQKEFGDLHEVNDNVSSLE